MSIQYPSGVKAQYTGALDQQADSGSGEVEWLWNGGNTALVVVWITTSTYNVPAGLAGIRNNLLAAASNVTMTEQGVATIAGHSWQYQTFSFTLNGVSGYVTFAVAYYTDSGRAYALGYIDTTTGTLASLESYGGTFTG